MTNSEMTNEIWMSKLEEQAFRHLGFDIHSSFSLVIGYLGDGNETLRIGPIIDGLGKIERASLTWPKTSANRKASIR